MMRLIYRIWLIKQIFNNKMYRKKKRFFNKLKLKLEDLFLSNSQKSLLPIKILTHLLNLS